MVNSKLLNHIYRIFPYLLAGFLLVGCGASEEDKIDDAIDIALSFLTTGDCQRAIDVLEDVGRQPKNYRYVKTLASGYACRAGYSTVTVFSDDLTKMTDPSLIGGFARFTGADEMDAPDESSYEDMQEAIDILLYAGGISTSSNPTSERRLRYFSEDQVLNMNTLLLYLSMVQLGKYAYFYGNSDNAGVKGGGAGSNTCLLNYTNIVFDSGFADMDTYLAGAGGACTSSADDGNPFLGSDGNLNVKRVCQGVVIMNTFLDSLTSVIDLLSGDDFGDLSGILTNLNTAKDNVAAYFTAAADATITQNQSECQSIYEGDTDGLEIYFAVFYEALY